MAAVMSKPCLIHWIFSMFQFISLFIYETKNFELLVCMSHSSCVQWWTRQMPSLSLHVNHFLKSLTQTRGHRLLWRVSHEVMTKWHTSNILPEGARGDWSKNSLSGKNCSKGMKSNSSPQYNWLGWASSRTVWTLELKRQKLEGKGVSVQT